MEVAAFVISIFALAEKHKVPVRFIGVGEGVEDLQTFVAKDFVDALLSTADLEKG